MNGVITLWACPKSYKPHLSFMADENDKGVDESFDEIKEDENTDWKSETIKLREKAIRQREKTKTLRDAIKAHEEKIAEFEKSAKKEEKPDDKLLERLDKMALQVAGITEADEVELYNKWKKDTGREADDIVGSSIFKKELDDMRVTKANLRATSEIKGGTGESGAKSTPDYWISKATKGADGKLAFPEETPKELYPQIVAKLGAGEPGASSGKLSFHDQ